MRDNYDWKYEAFKELERQQTKPLEYQTGGKDEKECEDECHDDA